MEYFEKYFEPNVVIVDDKKEEIQGIIDHYQKLGIGCRYFNADVSDGDSYPEKPMSDVMLLFLDLYYKEEVLDHGFDAELAASWVRTMIHPNTFYILVLWTKDPTQADRVIEILKNNNMQPYLSLIRGKNEYFKKDSQKYDYDSLIKSINDKIEEMHAIEEILIWKNTLKGTSNVVLGGLISDSVNEFTNKLKKIIIGYGGEVISKSQDYRRKRATLFEALDNVLISNTPQYDSRDEILESNQKDLYDLQGTSTIPVDKQLNSWFHFILKKDLKDKISPGIIAKNNSLFLQKHYSIKDDLRITELISDQTLDNIEDIVLNITRPCDYAQNKYGKNLKLLSGLAIKNPIRKNNERNEVKLKGRYDSVIVFDHLFHDQDINDLVLIFDFRYSFSLPEHVFLKKFENVKMLNKDLLSEIQVSYSNYVNRLGYTTVF